MDINNARSVLTQMQACFMESGLQIVTESENLDQKAAADYLIFRSYVARDHYLAQIQTFLWLSHKVVQLSMFFQAEMPGGIFPTLLALMNNINLSNAGSYWTAVPRFKKIEFRTAYVLPDDRLNKEQFKGALKKFLDQGLLQDDYLTKLMVSPGGLIN
jgi:hypothetical protein